MYSRALRFSLWKILQSLEQAHPVKTCIFSLVILVQCLQRALARAFTVHVHVCMITIVCVRVHDFIAREATQILFEICVFHGTVSTVKPSIS